AGVVLTVTPRIGERGTVALDVKQEVNSVGPPVPPTNSPSFIKREAETSVVLLNNQTLVLGGLIQDTVTNNDQGIPYMKSIPILGYLFGFKEKKLAKTELLLLITPRVIGTAVDAARITNEMRRTTPELNEAIRSAPRAPAVLPPPGSPVPVPMPTGAPATPSSSTTPPPGVGAPAPPRRCPGRRRARAPFGRYRPCRRRLRARRRRSRRARSPRRLRSSVFWAHRPRSRDRPSIRPRCRRRARSVSSCRRRR